MAWSEWYPLEMGSLSGSTLPESAGIYEIRVDHVIQRVRGSSRIINIGRVVSNLKNRVSGKAKDDDQLPAPLQWLKVNAREGFEVRWIRAENNNEAKALEKVRLAQYIYEHWELPPGNDRGPEKITQIADYVTGQNPQVTAEILEVYTALVKEMGPI